MNTKQKSLKGIFMALVMIFSLFGVMPQVELEADAGGYNPSAAVSYAHKYALNYNPNYSNYNSIGGDCANFVSQCLHAGGLEMTSGWYWYSYNNRSGSWAACASMYTYFKNAGYTIIENPSNSQLKAGNPVLYYSSSKGRWSHAAICVGTNSSGTPLVSAHNNDHDSVDWKLGSGWSKRCTILISDGDTPDPNPPTYSKLTANKTSIAVGEEITFTASSDYATGFTIGVDNETSRYITQDISNGQITLTFDKAGSYGAYVTAWNSYGLVDSEWISFTVYDSAPTYSKLIANKTSIAVGEEITFTALSDLANVYWMGIDDENGRYITNEMPNGKLTLTFNKTGSYSAYVTSSNPLGGKDSVCIYFTVYDPDELNISDTVILQKYILGMQTLTQEQAKFADLTQDGIINIFDLTLLKHKLFS